MSTNFAIGLIGCALCGAPAPAWDYPHDKVVPTQARTPAPRKIEPKAPPRARPKTIVIPGYAPPLPLPGYFVPDGKGGWQICTQNNGCRSFR
jgi:hypothetical protein